MFFLYKTYANSFLATVISFSASALLFLAVIGIISGIYEMFTAVFEEGLAAFIFGVVGIGLGILMKKGAEKVNERACRKKLEKAVRNLENNNQQNG